MKNSWKGLAVGAFSGAAIGIVMDLVASGSRRAVELGASVKQAVQDKAPDAREWAETKSHQAADWVRDQELGEKAKHVVDKVHPE